MDKVLIAVDDSKGSLRATDLFLDVFPSVRPSVVLLYVEKIEGHSLMDEMLGEAEMSTLKEELKKTEYKEKLDKKAGLILAHFRKALNEGGVEDIKEVVRVGHPADEILQAAEEEGVGMIIIGSRGRRLHTFLMGSVSREVSNRSEISVLVAK